LQKYNREKKTIWLYKIHAPEETRIFSIPSACPEKLEYDKVQNYFIFSNTLGHIATYDEKGKRQ
jgi:hypothetical protein